MQNLGQIPPEPTGVKSLLTSLLAKLLAVFAIVASSYYLLNSFHKYQPPIVANIPIKQSLTIVTTDSPSTVFYEGGVKHGFGYDLARLYANDLDIELDFHIVESNEDALNLLKQGKADIAMTSNNEQDLTQTNLTSLPISCGNTESLEQHGLDTNLKWIFASQQDPFLKSATQFVCENQLSGMIEKLASFYSPNVVHDSSWFLIKRDLADRLPTYKDKFKRTAAEYNLDWHLLAAIGYQESHLKPDSVSPTGVRGIMMLTNDTAKAMGVEDREDPMQSIRGGAKYFNKMMKFFDDIPEPDRTWFALAGYNMGPNAVRRAQKEVEAEGKNPNEWVNVYDYLQRHQEDNPRYAQAIHYVTRIRAYLEHIKTTQEKKPKATTEKLAEPTTATEKTAETKTATEKTAEKSDNKSNEKDEKQAIISSTNKSEIKT